MSCLWVEEGSLQFRLGMGFQWYAYLLEKHGVVSPGRGESLPEFLRSQVIAPFIEREWIFGIRHFVNYFPRAWNEGVSGYSPSRCDDVTGRFAKLIDESLHTQSNELPVAKVRKQIESNLTACVNDVWIPRVKKESPAQLPRASEFVVDDRDAVSNWLAQGIALFNWSKLTPDLEEMQQSGELYCSIQTLIEHLRTFRVDVERKWDDCKRRRRRLFYRDAPTYRSHLKRTRRIILGCEEAFAALLPKVSQLVPDEDLKERCRTLDAITEDLDPASNGWACWTPQLLAKLQADLLQIEGPRVEGLLQSVRTNTEDDSMSGTQELDCDAASRARVVLLQQIVDYLDMLADDRPLQPEVWKKLNEWSDELLPGAGFRIKFLRDGSMFPEYVTATESEPYDAPRVVATGMVAVFSKAGSRKPVPVRLAEIEEPRKLSPLHTLLKEFSQRIRALDASLAALCMELHRKLKPHSNLFEWWDRQSDKANARALLWRLLQRIVGLDDSHYSGLPTDTEDLITRTLLEFELEGVRLVEPDREATADTTDGTGPWILVADQTAQTSTSSRPLRKGLGIRTPDGKTIAPSVWLRVSAPKAARPLVRCLIDNEQLLAGLKVREPDWDGWPKYNEQVWNLVHCFAPGDPQTHAQSDRKYGTAAFQALYDHAFNHDGPNASFYKELARALYRTLTKDMDVTVVPPLDPITLEPAKLDGPPTDGTETHWVASNRTSRTVLSVERFASGDHPARLRVSLGPGFPNDIEEWIRLPAPRFLHRETNADCPLRDFHDELQQSVWDPQRAKNCLEHHHREFQRYVVSTEGLEWYDRLVHTVLDPQTEADGVALRWFRQLRECGWVRCLPEVDPQKSPGTVFWPPDESTDAPGLGWAFSENVPRGEALRMPVQFAPSRLGARGEFSLGPRQPGSAVDFAVQMEKMIGEDQLLDRGLENAVRQLVAKIRDHLFEIATRDDLQRQVERLLSQLLQSSRHPQRLEEDASVWQRPMDGLLELTREICSEFSLDILPHDWSFAQPIDFERLSPENRQYVRTEFSDTLPLGAVRLEEFAIWDMERSNQEPPPSYCVIRSAGAAPCRYDELLRELRSLPHPEAEKLLERALQWPEAAIESVGELTWCLELFFGRYWDELAAKLQQGCLEAHDRIRGSLDELLLQFDREVQYPHRLDRFPQEWLESPPDRSSRGPFRVLRPALVELNPNRNCLVKARVIQE